MGAKERDIVEPAAVYRAFSPFSRMPIGESDMANLTEQWGRILTDNFDRWLEALLATLKKRKHAELGQRPFSGDADDD